jgi:hypothetical protein
VNVGPYEIVREIGRGGMGVVYEVRHPSTPRRLALKVVLDEGAAPNELERFRREARLLTRVRHPSIVAVHAIDQTEDGRDYLVTDLIEGPTLTRARRDGAIDPRRAALIVRELALAVEEVHKNGILHRDLKPENVILTPEGVPVLLDFGLARDASSERLTRTGVVIGTAAYMPPEQAEGGRVTELDARTDVYALGATLYFLLAGVAPFDGTTTQMLYAVLQKDPEWPRDAPRDLVTILKKAMAKQREARYARAADLAADLADFVEGKRPSAAGTRSGPPVVRIALAVGVPLVAAAVVMTAILARKSPEPAASGPAPGPASVTSQATTADPPRDDPAHPLRSYRQLAQWVKKHPEAKKLLHKAETKHFPSIPLGMMAHANWVGPTTLFVSAQVDAGPYVVDVDVNVPSKMRIAGVPPAGFFSQAVCRLPDGTVRCALGGNRCAFLIKGDPSKPESMSGREIPLIPAGTELLPDTQPNDIRMLSIALSPDGRRVAGGGDWRDIFVLDLEDPAAKPTRLTPTPPDTVNALAFSSDGERLLACTGHGNTEPGCAVTCFDLPHGTSHRQPRASIPFSIAVAGGRIAYGCGEGEIYLASVDELEGTCLTLPDEWKQDEVKAIQGLALVPGDRVLAISGEYFDGKGGSRVFTRATTNPKGPVHVIAGPFANLLTSLDVSEDGLFAAIGHYKPAVIEVRAIPD